MSKQRLLYIYVHIFLTETHVFYIHIDLILRLNAVFDQYTSLHLHTIFNTIFVSMMYLINMCNDLFSTILRWSGARSVWIS